MMSSVTEYIAANIDRSIYQDAGGSGFKGIDLPFPYTSPCIKGEGKFSFFFYWDTYFTNLALLRTGRESVARDNIRNMLWLIGRQGYMPNHVAIYNRSQPPYLCRMVKEYLSACPREAGSDFHRQCAEGLRQEYNFWITARHTPSGLSRYGHHDTAAGCTKFYNGFMVRRLGMPADAPEGDKVRIGGEYMANAEAGCDFSGRFAGRCTQFCATDLNALLYEYELFLGEASGLFGWNDAAWWAERAAARRERVESLLWNKQQGVYLDYDYIGGGHAPVASLAAFNLLATGMAGPERAAAMAARLPLFERAHGVAVTPEYDGCRNWQWDFPNVWPPMVYVTVESLRRYGFHDDARRIAHTYIATTDRLFAKTGQLWEKTDAETGEVAGGEYDAAPMIGWTAGVYLALQE